MIKEINIDKEMLLLKNQLRNCQEFSKKHFFSFKILFLVHVSNITKKQKEGMNGNKPRSKKGFA